jgi:ElaB/YqjD/DUF883 family membrane-anchored ribosome-binding protein
MRFAMADTLPEGTDHVIPGAANNSTRDKLKSDAADLRDKASTKASEIKDQAADKARTYAEDGKARASAGLDSVAKMIGDSATQIDEKLGAAYGDYARRAADAVSGFSDNLREKEVEELLDDARDLVRRSPALAIGAAAAAGFVIARLVKAGSEMLDETAKAATPKAPVKASDEDKTAADISDSVRKAPSKRKPRSEA